MKRASTLVVLSLLASARAHADDADETLEFTVRVSGGLELGTGTHTGVVGFRGRFALEPRLAVRSPEPRLAVGLTFGSGSFFNYAEPKSGTRHVYSYSDVGPEVMFTLDRVDDRREAKVFVAVAAIDKFFQYQFKDRTDGWGGRVTIGANWVRAWPRMIERANDGRCEACWFGLLVALFAPHQAELSCERNHGTTRVGVTLSYGY